MRSLLVPRDVAGASRALFALTTVSALVLVVASLTIAGACLPWWGLSLLLPVVLASRALRRVTDPRSWIWSAVPLIGIALVIVLACTARGQCWWYLQFLFFPATYAARQLRRRGAMLVIGGCAAAILVVTLSLDPARNALTESLFLGGVLVATSTRLAATGERIATLLDQLETQASKDPLTGLVTRRRLDQLATAAIAAQPAHGVAMVLLDMDNFKTINDRFGHPAGDAVLVQVSQLLQHNSRSGDVIGRLGGDEIAVLLPDMPLATALTRAEAIREHICAHRLVLPDGDAVAVSVSAGVAHAPTDAVDLRGLYASADRALYRSKNGGRNQVSTPGAPTRPVLRQRPA
ncbi:MAG TPA: GGDEF domain-containing protein [Jatrophihabitans sp.]|nr:GGDEF domain-containing protein [Jatrophihabitans sp.]